MANGLNLNRCPTAAWNEVARYLSSCHKPQEGWIDVIFFLSSSLICTTSAHEVIVIFCGDWSSGKEGQFITSYIQILSNPRGWCTFPLLISWAAVANIKITGCSVLPVFLVLLPIPQWQDTVYNQFLNQLKNPYGWVRDFVIEYVQYVTKYPIINELLYLHFSLISSFHVLVIIVLCCCKIRHCKSNCG